MVICLSLYHPTVSSLTKCKLLRMTFHEEDYEIDIYNSRTVLIYLWNIDMLRAQKMVRSFEFAQIDVGYGAGKFKKEAKELALLHSNVNKNKQRNHHSTI